MFEPYPQVKNALCSGEGRFCLKINAYKHGELNCQLFTRYNKTQLVYPQSAHVISIKNMDYSYEKIIATWPAYSLWL